LLQDGLQLGQIDDDALVGRGLLMATPSALEGKAQGLERLFDVGCRDARGRAHVRHVHVGHFASRAQKVAHDLALPVQLVRAIAQRGQRPLWRSRSVFSLCQQVA